jgi:hypothetical protein
MSLGNYILFSQTQENISYKTKYLLNPINCKPIEETEQNSRVMMHGHEIILKGREEGLKGNIISHRR